MVPLVFGQDVNLEYKLAVKAAKQGEIDFAYMHYREILRNFTQTKYHEKALFAKGEYFFYIPDYPQAKMALETYLQEYADRNPRGKIFALAYLYKIAEIQNNQEELKRLADEIVSFKQLSLVFKDHKELKFISPFQRQSNADFYIDKVEFFIEDELFIKITY